MKVVIQRVNKSSVEINNKIKSEIQKGLLVLIGIGLDDNNIIVLNNNSYKLEDKYLLNLKLFWGNRTLIIDTNSLKFGNYKKGKCTMYTSYDELTNSLLNCKNNSCDHN